jgi:hypothetical protein
LKPYFRNGQSFDRLADKAYRSGVFPATVGMVTRLHASGMMAKREFCQRL